MIDHCEVCGNTTLIPVLNLGSHPLPDDLKRIGDHTPCTEYPVEVLFCDQCKTAHQKYPVPRQLLFPPTYHYRARQTQDVLDGMKQFVQSCRQQMPLHSRHVLDIGCNDGSLLTEFQKEGAYTYGIEPTDAASEASRAGHEVLPLFFDKQTAADFLDLYPQPDVITFTNVFAHIEDLDHLLAALDMVRKPTTWIVIENHYLGSVLDRNQFDTFYHEHPRTYSFNSFFYIALRLRMHVAAVEFPARYGGNIRVFLAPGEGLTLRPINENSFFARLHQLNEKVVWWKARRRAQLLKLILNRGPLAAAAFPGRAAILLRLLGFTTPSVIEAVFEKPGSRKIGCYAPSTTIPIVSDEVFQNGDEMTRPVLNMAWHIPVEIEARWRGFGFTGNMLQCVSQEDFR